MALVGADPLRCVGCAHGFTAQGARSLGPAGRPAILAGTLHRVACPNCGLWMRFERALLYLDVDRHQLVQVQPPDQLEQFAHHEACLDAAVKHLAHPLQAVGGRPPRVRLVFGQDALREKLVLWDAGLDDALVELMKRELRLRRPTLGTLRVREVSSTSLVFEGPLAGSLRIPRARYERFERARPWLFTTWPDLFRRPWVDSARPAPPL